MREQDKLDLEFYQSLKKVEPEPIKRHHRGHQFSDGEIEETKRKILEVLPGGFIFNGAGLEKYLKIDGILILIAMDELRQDGEIMYAKDVKEPIPIIPIKDILH